MSDIQADSLIKEGDRVKVEFEGRVTSLGNRFAMVAPDGELPSAGIWVRSAYVTKINPILPTEFGSVVRTLSTQPGIDFVLGGDDLWVSRNGIVKDSHWFSDVVNYEIIREGI